MLEPLESGRSGDDATDVIVRRLESSLTLVVGLLILAAVVLGHAFSRLPSAHFAEGGVERDVLAELVVGSVLAVAAAAAWLADGARRSSGHLMLSRVITVGLLVGAAVTGAVALLTEAGNGCLGACG
jgi:hypothetical protein